MLDEEKGKKEGYYACYLVAGYILIKCGVMPFVISSSVSHNTFPHEWVNYKFLVSNAPF